MLSFTNKHINVGDLFLILEFWQALQDIGVTVDVCVGVDRCDRAKVKHYDAHPKMMLPLSQHDVFPQSSLSLKEALRRHMFYGNGPFTVAASCNQGRNSSVAASFLIRCALLTHYGWSEEGLSPYHLTSMVAGCSVPTRQTVDLPGVHRS